MANVNKKMLKKMQDNFIPIRKIMGWRQQDLADKLGVSKQTINNIENNRQELNKAQYIAIRMIIDCEIENRPKEERDYIKGAMAAILGDFDNADEETKQTRDLAIMATGAAISGLAAVAATGAALALGGVGKTGGGALLSLAKIALKQSKWLQELDNAGNDK